MRLQTLGGKLFKNPLINQLGANNDILTKASKYIYISIYIYKIKSVSHLIFSITFFNFTFC